MPVAVGSEAPQAPGESGPGFSPHQPPKTSDRQQRHPSYTGIGYRVLGGAMRRVVPCAACPPMAGCRGALCATSEPVTRVGRPSGLLCARPPGLMAASGCLGVCRRGGGLPRLGDALSHPTHLVSCCAERRRKHTKRIGLRDPGLPSPWASVVPCVAFPPLTH